MFPIILTSFLTQLISTLGCIIVLGFLIFLVSKLFYKTLGENAMIACYVTGFIGTPIHELSHALMCLIFGHKITSMRLYQIGSVDGTLGYVEHSYNKRNIYQRIGNLFIGIAPIVFGTIILMLLFRLLIPSVYLTCKAYISVDSLKDIPSGLFNSLKTIFSFRNMGNFKWWIFIVLCAFVSIHMNLSTADIKGSFSGLILFIVILFVECIIAGFVNINLLTKINNLFLFFGETLLSFCLIAVSINLLLTLITLLVKAIFKRR